MEKDMQELMHRITEVTELRSKYQQNGMGVEVLDSILQTAVEMEKVKELRAINKHLCEIADIVMSWEENDYGKR